MWIGKVVTLRSRKKNRTMKVDRLVPKAMPGLEPTRWGQRVPPGFVLFVESRIGDLDF